MIGLACYSQKWDAKRRLIDQLVRVAADAAEIGLYVNGDAFAVVCNEINRQLIVQFQNAGVEVRDGSRG